MSYCPKCGREILDESLGCPVCGVKENKVSLKKEPEGQKAEPVTSFTVEDGNGNSQRFESRTESSGAWSGDASVQPESAKTLPVALKVAVIVMMVMVGGIGAIVGILGGVAMMKSPFEDYRSFGKTMVVLGCVLLGLCLLCCVVNGAVAGAVIHNIPYTY